MGSARFIWTSQGPAGLVVHHSPEQELLLWPEARKKAVAKPKSPSKINQRAFHKNQPTSKTSPQRLGKRSSARLERNSKAVNEQSWIPQHVRDDDLSVRQPWRTSSGCHSGLLCRNPFAPNLSARGKSAAQHLKPKKLDPATSAG